MDKKAEEIAEGILRHAIEHGGETLFCNYFKEIPGCIKSVNLILSIYGNVHGKMTNDKWTYFTISPAGIEFIENGGFSGEKEREDYKREMENFNRELAKLNMESLEYKKKIRHQESVIRIHKYIQALSWIVSAVLAFLLFFLKK